MEGAYEGEGDVVSFLAGGVDGREWRSSRLVGPDGGGRCELGGEGE